MKNNIIDGKEIAKNIRAGLAKEIEMIKEKYGKVPGLAVILVGNDPASHTYVSMKEKACKKIGIYSEVHRLSEDTTQDQIIELIEKLNKDDKIDGILVQLPLPKGINENIVNYKISPEKDVDGFHAINAGNLFLGEKSFVPCTPKGIIRLIKETGIEIEGKNAVVVGRSNIVGKPTAILLLNENATVKICHSRTRDLAKHVKEADILVSAVGKPEIIKGEMIKEGAVVIDAGTTKVDGKLVGDVEFDLAKDRASWITPVPGGVGPMTITMLLENTLEAFKKRWNLEP
ncbi:bifunctional methylenetetrahydrofolate dehydrogenase/methenyltetrahydrofolate cyclohydrolase FolD [Caloranaerobacter azorensis]|uniref:Bifunctional protein FolD n=1 Tax=Caloranaerobacter azorensis TaxID=116090 RepID=A0A6P1YAC6_9FIRM|nr:bifunctional methylenetetrahydrofolate dehydrogenase/methenyltetrahydrofolate cyclohydrolase FolD [Caloranaerobacter azorensis]QIB26014.1 bifunctional methylenetetrahydrofolate dehydrogenase/methenyltetrahydrofolate cyclohydrolase FolD [Caloranaerobacter azorensis]